MARTDLVILRAWRDGSVHAEILTATFPDKAGVIETHAVDDVRTTFESMCGESFWGVVSGTGYTHPDAVDCKACQALLLGEDA